MLSAPLSLSKIDATKIYEFLYSLFHRDFVAGKTYLNRNIWIDPQSRYLDDGKEKAFWHLTTRKQTRQIKVGNRYEKIEERLTDFRRAERIEWVKKIIENHANPRVRCFYHMESSRDRPIRLYLWAHADDFVVILQKLGRSSSFLVTSFYIDHADKRQDYSRRYQRYISGTAVELQGCDWF